MLLLLLWNVEVLHPFVHARAGNFIFRHAFLRLRAACAGRVFIDLSAWHVAQPLSLNWLAWGYENCAFEEGDGDGYRFDFAIYKNHRALLARLLSFFPEKKRFDVVVHVRLDDVFGPEPAYTFLPRAFYEKALPRARRVAVVGHPVDAQQRLLLKNVAAYVKQKTGARVFLYANGTMKNDFAVLASAGHVVGSTSTFWFWPAFLSGATWVAPDYGVIQHMRLPFRLGVNLTRKMTREEALDEWRPQ